MTTIEARPTWFRGVQYRSRLESKWAALFEIAQWPADYEPADVELANYIPDFLIRFQRAPIAVEVKPLCWDGSDAERSILDAAQAKLQSWEGEALIVGAFVDHALGLIRSDGVWQHAFTFRCLDCGCRSFAAESDSWHCRVNGCYFGKRHIGVDGWDRIGDFKEAANRVQWRAPR